MDIKYTRSNYRLTNRIENPEKFPESPKKLKRKILISVFLFLFFLALFGYLFNYQSNYSRGTSKISQNFDVQAGERIQEIGERLERSNLIRNAYYFDYYVWKTKSKGKIQAGSYELSGNMTIPEIVQVMSIGAAASNQAKVTFPEGTRIEEMADILNQKGFNGDEFLRIAKSGKGAKTDCAFLKDRPNNASLEGFLFPDTYIFKKDATAEQIINIMLQNFDDKLTPDLREEISASGHNIFEVVTMASILEKEVKTSNDMKIVSGIFWKRVQTGGRLQSDATLEYILGTKDLQHSIADTNVDSSYNTYRNSGLPPGPINNPGLVSINAAASPTSTDYNYFLTDPETGKVVYSKTFDEHVANKNKYGL